MKPFDIEEAKKGRPLCTRDGREARIISFDKHDAAGKPIVVLVKFRNSDMEYVITVTPEGRYFGNAEPHKLDLFFKTRTITGWINMLVLEDSRVINVTPGCVYKSKEEAERYIPKGFEGAVPTEISWEEYL